MASSHINLTGDVSNNATTEAPPLNNSALLTVEKISCFVLVVLIILALFGNSLVWAAFITVKRLQRVTNFYIVSLATADLLVTSFAMTTWLLHLLFQRTILVGATMTTVYTMIDIACGTASIMNLTFVSIDRYVAITRPFSYQAILSPPRVLVTIAFSWLYAITVSLLKFCFQSKEYSLFVSIMSFFLPTAMLVFTYSCIFAVARRHVRVINVVSGGRLDRKSCYVTEMKAAKVIGIVVGAFLVCWAPFLLTNLIVNFCRQCAMNMSRAGVSLLKVLQYSSSALNPYIYTCLNAEFRVAVKRLVCRKCMQPDEISLSRMSGMKVEGRTSHLKSTVNTGHD